MALAEDLLELLHKLLSITVMQPMLLFAYTVCLHHVICLQYAYSTPYCVSSSMSNLQ